MNDTLQLLAQHEVFAQLSPEELKELEQILTQKTYKAGELVFDKDQVPNNLFFIKHGSFTLKLANNEYKSLTEGQIFGEIGIINKDFRSGSVHAAEDAEVICVDGKHLFDSAYIPPATALKIISVLAKRITNYLRSKEQISTKEIIELGENDHVEFKSTLRWNLRAEKKDKAIENAALKTMIAFMNSKGGTLIVGCADDGTILGLENDKFQNHDKMLLHLTSLIKKRIGSLYIPFLEYSIEKIGDKFVLRIDCLPASMPAYLIDDNQDHFYIRTGPSSTSLRLSKVYAYIKERFYS